MPEDCAVVQETSGQSWSILSLTSRRRCAGPTRRRSGSARRCSRHGAARGRRPAPGRWRDSVMTFVGMSSIPFGGVGESGFGRFRGEEGCGSTATPSPPRGRGSAWATTCRRSPAAQTSSMSSARHPGGATAGHSTEPVWCLRPGAGDLGL